jgi:hypothetical protein
MRMQAVMRDLAQSLALFTREIVNVSKTIAALRLEYPAHCSAEDDVEVQEERDTEGERRDECKMPDRESDALLAVGATGTQEELEAGDSNGGRTSACVSMRQHASAYGATSIRQHTSANVKVLPRLHALSEKIRTKTLQSRRRYIIHHTSTHTHTHTQVHTHTHTHLLQSRRRYIRQVHTHTHTHTHTHLRVYVCMYI